MLAAGESDLRVSQKERRLAMNAAGVFGSSVLTGWQGRRVLVWNRVREDRGARLEVESRNAFRAVQRGLSHHHREGEWNPPKNVYHRVIDAFATRLMHEARAHTFNSQLYEAFKRALLSQDPVSDVRTVAAQHRVSWVTVEPMLAFLARLPLPMEQAGIFYQTAPRTSGVILGAGYFSVPALPAERIPLTSFYCAVGQMLIEYESWPPLRHAFHDYRVARLMSMRSTAGAFLFGAWTLLLGLDTLMVYWSEEGRGIEAWWD